MITFKCKMCGGDLSFEPGASVAECPYCGTTQTLPKLDDDRRANLYDRANHFRRQNEYDKAMAIYEQILAEDHTDAEAYWSLVLCRYGIEYVEDPASHKRVPTVNRAQYASILADEDYKSALNYADTLQRGVYEAEANAIAEIQKGILDISKKEAPFDVFICYKETDANGRRTPDSVLATDLYHQLTKEGFKVFFSRITLEDKIGTAYEPYIFAALNSAKVMVVLGTKPEYFNAVWVKNEWSRYLALIKNGADKVLVPAYRDMDPYDLPEEFAHLQAQDMGKLGFMQDLIRGIKKLTEKEAPKPQPAVQRVVTSGGANVDNLMKRARLFMEDGDWASATEYLDKVLDEDAEYAPAYAGKVQAVLKLRKEEELSSSLTEYEKSPDWQKALRFATPEQKKVYEGYVASAKAIREEKRKSDIYHKAEDALETTDTPEACAAAKALFAQVPGYRNADERKRDCDNRAENIRANWYAKACHQMEEASLIELQEAESTFRKLGRYKNAPQLQNVCETLCQRLEKKWSLEAQMTKLSVKAPSATAIGEWDGLAEAFSEIGDHFDAVSLAKKCAENAENMRATLYDEGIALMRDAKGEKDYYAADVAFKQLGGYRDAPAKVQECERLAAHARGIAEEKAKAEAVKRRKQIITIVVPLIVTLAAVVCYFSVIKPNLTYNSAVKAMNAGNYDEATSIFERLGDYKDAATQVRESKYQKGLALQSAGNYDEAKVCFGMLGEYGDAHVQALESQYQKAQHLMDAREYDEAVTVFADIVEVVDQYGDEEATEVVEEAVEKVAEEAIEEHAEEAVDAAEYVAENETGTAINLENKDSLNALLENKAPYRDSLDKARECRYLKGMALLEAGDYDDAIEAFISIYSFSDSATMVQESQYQKAEKQLSDGDYDGATNTFEALGNYRDAATQVKERQYQKGCALLEQGRSLEALLVFRKIGLDYKDAAELLKPLERMITENARRISAGDDHTVGIRADGTVAAVGNNGDGQCDTGDWTDIVAVAAGEGYTVGLRADGIVVAVGNNSYGQCDTGAWTDIVAVTAVGGHTVGLRADGTVAAVGYNDYGQCDTDRWTDIVAVAIGSSYTVGLRADGTVAAVGYNEYSQCDTGDWTDIVAVAAGWNHTVGLKADGTVVAVGVNSDGECDTGGWTDIVAIAAGDFHTVGLRADGTVVAVGANSDGECDAGDWTDIVAVAAGGYHSVGLRADGTVVAVGKNEYGQCDTGDWKLWD